MKIHHFSIFLIQHQLYFISFIFNLDIVELSYYIIDLVFDYELKEEILFMYLDDFVNNLNLSRPWYYLKGLLLTFLEWYGLGLNEGINGNSLEMIIEEYRDIMEMLMFLYLVMNMVSIKLQHPYDYYLRISLHFAAICHPFSSKLFPIIQQNML